MKHTNDFALCELLKRVSFPTLGHFLESGFVDHGMRALVPNAKMIGRTVTLKLACPDAIDVNRALALLNHGDVLVIDTGGNHGHAPVGAVTATAALLAGAAGIVVDGVVTDLAELRAIGLPVYARGTSLLTTKRIDGKSGAFGVPVRCGNVVVKPGMIVLGDENGLMFSDRDTLSSVIEQALECDRAEPKLLDRLRAGEPVATVLSGVREE